MGRKLPHVDGPLCINMRSSTTFTTSSWILLVTEWRFCPYSKYAFDPERISFIE